MTRVAFVTGASSGIGEAVARTLAESGLTVALADIATEAAERLAAELGNSAFAVECDVTSNDSVKAAVAQVIDRTGRFDVLVNSAGASLVTPFVTTQESDWDRLVDLNLLGVYRTVHAVLPTMLAQQHGRIITISSETGRLGGKNEAAYSGTKGGVIAFSKAIAREVGNDGITVNCVAPGPINTPPLQRLVDQDAAEHLQRALDAMPISRVGEPSEVADAVLYLVGDGAAYVTGQTISVGGGLSMV